MKTFKSFLKRLLGGEILEKFFSPFNGEILLVRELSGQLIIRIGGITQSGGRVREIWESALKEVKKKKLSAGNVLILGLGAGTVAELLAKKWPEAKMTGIEIDPQMVAIGKKYFGLKEIPGLKIIMGDALKLVNSSKIKSGNYSLILVDLYQGQKFPPGAESENFLKSLKKISTGNGLIIFNRLNFASHKMVTSDFVKKLKKHFPLVYLKKEEFNLLIFLGVN